MPEDQPPRTEDRADEPSPSAPEPPQTFTELRHYVPAELLDVAFPVSVRGYDRGAVESYIKRVNRVVAQLKVNASPRAAVTHALEQTEQQVSGLLQRARETGEEITASAREEADEIIAKAKAEAAELLVNVSTDADGIKAEAETLLSDARTEAEDTLARSRLEADNTLARARSEAEERRRQLEEELAALREQAEAKMRDIDADTQAVREERQQLLVDIRAKASGLLELAEAATARGPDEELLEPEAVDDIERAGVGTSEPTAQGDDANQRVRRQRASRRR